MILDHAQPALDSYYYQRLLNIRQLFPARLERDYEKSICSCAHGSADELFNYATGTATV
jgi:hypothetical protein